MGFISVSCVLPVLQARLFEASPARWGRCAI